MKRSWFLVFSSVLAISFSTQVKDETSDVLELPPYFERSVYTARVIDRKIELIDGPIILKGGWHYDYDVVAIENDKYYVFLDSDLSPDCCDNCSISFSALVKDNVEPKEVLYDTISLEIHMDLLGAANARATTATIVIVYSSEYDPYKLVYNINGTEYVILNYFYFKLFLLLIIATGILLLILEIREIILKYKTKPYTSIDQVNYI